VCEFSHIEKALNLFNDPPSLLSDWLTQKKDNYNLILVVNCAVVSDIHTPTQHASLTKFRRTNLSRACACMCAASSFGSGVHDQEERERER